MYPMPHSDSRQRLWQWSTLAVVSLAIAGVFAGLLVLSRAPGVSERVPWPEDFFNKGLVVHVSLSFIIWFFAIFGASMVTITAYSNIALLCSLWSLVLSKGC